MSYRDRVRPKIYSNLPNGFYDMSMRDRDQYIRDRVEKETRSRALIVPTGSFGELDIKKKDVPKLPSKLRPCAEVVNARPNDVVIVYSSDPKHDKKYYRV